MKYDTDKAPLALIPPQVINDGHNTQWSRTYSSIQRHLNSFWDGEDLDLESGKTHLAHAATQLVILMQHINDGHTKMDDRYKKDV